MSKAYKITAHSPLDAKTISDEVVIAGSCVVQRGADVLTDHCFTQVQLDAVVNLIKSTCPRLTDEELNEWERYV